MGKESGSFSEGISHNESYRLKENLPDSKENMCKGLEVRELLALSGTGHRT